MIINLREAYAYGLIEDGEQWIDMMVDRNKTSRLYDEEEAKRIYEKIKCKYSNLLSTLCLKLEGEIKKMK